MTSYTACQYTHSTTFTLWLTWTKRAFSKSCFPGNAQPAQHPSTCQTHVTLTYTQHSYFLILKDIHTFEHFPSLTKTDKVEFHSRSPKDYLLKFTAMLRVIAKTCIYFFHYTLRQDSSLDKHNPNKFSTSFFLPPPPQIRGNFFKWYWYTPNTNTHPVAGVIYHQWKTWGTVRHIHRHSDTNNLTKLLPLHT